MIALEKEELEAARILFDKKRTKSTSKSSLNEADIQLQYAMKLYELFTSDDQEESTK